MTKKNKILWVSWKDINHPQAGGAEIITTELRNRLVKNGYEVTHLTSNYPGSKHEETVEGVKTIRVGRNRYIHSFAAIVYYLRNLVNKQDIIIEEVNTAPYLLNLFNKNAKFYLFYNQLAREIWFYETKFPLNFIGYFLLEPLATIANAIKGPKLITISESTKTDLERFGHKDKNIYIIPMATHTKPLISIKSSIPKEKNFTIIYLGSLRTMKRPIEILKGFKVFVENNPEAKLWIAGGGSDFQKNKLIKYTKDNNLTKNVTFFGFISEEQKRELLQKAHVLAATSLKEGWGLIVTEAGLVATPSVVYNVDGLRDSCQNNITGMVTNRNIPNELAKCWQEMKDHQESYEIFRKNSYIFAQTLTFNNCFNKFLEIIENE
ncbi:glycosyltransferase family 4 protein [Candidatus Dojkabacteria bacterium]|nr:glycosyltransferase family 4 protein [Candidatus Dojkabacteria bacterium]